MKRTGLPELAHQLLASGARREAAGTEPVAAGAGGGAEAPFPQTYPALRSHMNGRHRGDPGPRHYPITAADVRILSVWKSM